MVFFGLPKNLVNFFTNFEIPQIVFLKLVSQDEELTENIMPVQKFICNSVILAIHSEKFRKIICAGSGEIYLYHFSDPEDTETVRNCIEFMYGNRSIVRQVDDIVGMFKFADIWDIPSLWFACLEQIKEELATNPNKIFEFYPKFDGIASQDWQQDLLSRELNRIMRTHADNLITHLIDQPCLLDVDHRMFEGLIKNSKTAACGKFLTLLLGSGDDHKNNVLTNLQSIPAATAFANESEFLSFKGQLSPSDRCKVIPITVEFYRHHSTEAVEANSPSLDWASDIEQPEDLHGATLDGPSVSSFDHGNENANSVSGSRNLEVISSCLQPKNVDRELLRKTNRVETIRKQLFATESSRRCRIPLSGYPALIKKNFSLYTGLDIVAHFISQSDCLNQLNLVNLLLPYFENPLIPASVLEDIKVIALRKCSKRYMRQTVDDDLQTGVVPDRIDTFVMDKTFYDIKLFSAELAQDKMIDLKLDDFIPCPIICCDSSESGGEFHTFKELKIDYASEPSIEFRSCTGSHKENIIHCYMLGISRNGTILSYIPLLQLTVSEIMDHIKEDTFFGVRVIVIFSKMSPEILDNFDNVLVGCLQQQGSIDKTDIVPSESKTTHYTLKSNAVNDNRDDIRDDLRKRTGKRRKQVLKKKIDYNLIKGYPLYTRLEFISLNISRSTQPVRLADILIPLILPYFKNPMVAVPLLEDLRALVLTKSVFSTSMRKKLDETVVVSDLPGRFETLSISKSFHDMTVFRDELSQNNRIRLQLDQGICCPLCHELSGSEQSHMINGFDIDLSLDFGIDFISENEIHKDHIIHCYMLGFAADGTALSYVSTLQLTVPEIVKASKKLSSVKIVVIYSKEFTVESEKLDKVLVQSIYRKTG